MKRPLEGMKVVDLTIWLYGPLAGTLLGDLGARVVKIERPGTGDFTRKLETLQGASMVNGDGRNLSYELFNRNKESITLDLRTPAGQSILHRLIAEADAFVTNFQPSTLAAFHALPSELLERNPRLVFGLGAGLGTKGRFADVASQDTAAMAYSGLMFTASSDPNVPFYPPGGMGDVLAGTNLAFGVVSALLGRERDGKGRLVTTSLLQTLMWTQMLAIGVPANNGQTLKGPHRTRATNPLMSTYLCSDARWIALGNPSLGDATWLRLADALEAPELTADARFATEAGRWAQREGAIHALDARFAQRPMAEWVDRLRAHELWCAPVNRPERLVDDPDVITEGLVHETDSGIRHVGPPFTVEGSEPRGDSAPELGSSTEAVLRELGFEPGEIARLRASRVI